MYNVGEWSRGRVLDSYCRGCVFNAQPGPNLEKVDNLLYAQVNSASYPQWD